MFERVTAAALLQDWFTDEELVRCPSCGRAALPRWQTATGGCGDDPLGPVPSGKGLDPARVRRRRTSTGRCAACSPANSSGTTEGSAVSQADSRHYPLGVTPDAYTH